MRSISLALIATAALAMSEQSETAAATEQELQNMIKYPEFAKQMLYWGYKWEPIMVKTEDGFNLTTFHLTGRTFGHPHKERDPSLNPVVMMNGLECDATSYFGIGDKNAPSIPLRLYERGFDVYLANNRGTKYSREHDKYTVDDAEFWDWTWMEMGSQDDIENIKMIVEKTGKKVSYIGASAGTVQMFYALAAHQDFLKDNMFMFAATDPCTIAIVEDKHCLEDGLFHFQDYGVYAFGGPNWDRDLKTICDNFDQAICDYATEYGSGEAFSVKSQVHWAQNSLQNRFQVYAPDYLSGKTQTDLVDLSKITHVPVTFWSGLLDDVCANSQAKISAAEIGERAVLMKTVPWGDHYNWGSWSAVGLSVYHELESYLINPEQERPFPHDTPAYATTN